MNKKHDNLGALLQNRDRKGSGPGYSRFVRALRVFLPLAALGVTGLVMLFAQSSENFERTEDDFTVEKPATNELMKPRFESRDENAQPYTITANKAIQSETQSNKIFLDKPVADMMTKKGAWLAVEADHGEYTENQEILVLKGNVQLLHDDGYSLRSQKMNINLESNTAQTDMPVEAHGPAGMLKARGLTAYQKENKIIFTGPAKLTLYNSDDDKILPN